MNHNDLESGTANSAFRLTNDTSSTKQVSKLLIFALAWFVAGPNSSWAQQKERGWHKYEENAFPGKPVYERSLALHPSGEPRPALKYRLIPSEFERNEGNAAVNYVRAMGFLERNSSRIQLGEFWGKAHDQSLEKALPIDQFPPYSWQGQSPDQLEIEEVKKFLQFTDFQVADLAAAHMLRDFDLNRNFRNVDNPYGILLPEVQQMREIARNQSLRCRVAIAEGRFEDAFATLGQQYAMANHLSKDPVLVSVLVGNAIAGITWDDALDIVQMPQAPNLYWALATLPKPLTHVQGAFAAEKELPFLQLKALQEVDEKPRPAGYWVEFIDRILVQYNQVFEATGQPPSAPKKGAEFLDRFGLVSLIGAGYPGARQYLIETEGLDPQRVDSFPMTQVFFLAQKKRLVESMDEQFKWTFLDYSSMKSTRKYDDFEERDRNQSARAGWIDIPSVILGPASLSVRNSSIRVEGQIALLQTIEAIRMYAADNHGQLPKRLADLPYPAPNDPSTGQPFNYQVVGKTGLLTFDTPQLIYRLKIKLAE